MGKKRRTGNGQGKHRDYIYTLTQKHQVVKVIRAEDAKTTHAEEGDLEQEER